MSLCHLFPLFNMFLRFIHVEICISIWFDLKILYTEYIEHVSFSTFWLWIMQVWTLVYKFLCWHMFTFLLGVCGVEILESYGNWTFNNYIFSFHIPISNVGEFQFPHTSCSSLLAVIFFFLMRAEQRVLWMLEKRSITELCT